MGQTDLPHNLAVDDSLVSRLDGGRVCQDCNVCIKLPRGFGMGTLSHQHHALPHKVSLDLLQGECSSLSRDNLNDGAL